jgi:hypothetical protein
LIWIDDSPSNTGKKQCRGSQAFDCQFEDPFHLIDEDTDCIASQKLWKSLKSALSLKWENVKKHDQPLQVLLDSTKWYVSSFVMVLWY